MCGIAGVISKGNVSVEIVSNMVKVMEKRGPDGSGILNNTDGNCVLGHARLSIIDLSENAHQPMSILDGRFTITFNGEIYNYKELKEDLNKKGACFASDSDTEVILWGWYYYGKRFVNELRGMFAFCIRDEELKITYLIRDRLGIKPLLYSIKSDTLVFASSVKAMIASGIIEKKINKSAIYDILTMGAVAQPRTIMDNVLSLMPGTILTIKKDLIIESDSYWSVSDIQTDLSLIKTNFQEIVEKTRVLLEEACRFHLVADVEVGSFLSGGVDSTAITALMTKISGQRINTFTIGFENNRGLKNELIEAAIAAHHIGTNHHEIILSGQNVADDFGGFIDAIDQPSIDGLNTYWVSKVTSKNIKVALSGLGADEAFAGYDSFLMMKKASEAPPNIIDRFMGKLYSIHQNRYTSKARFLALSPKLREVFFRTIMNDDEVIDLLSNDYKQNYKKGHFKDFVLSLNTNSEDPVNQYSKFELQGYLLNILLRDADALSMANGLEVRPVFLDHKLIEFALSIPANVKLKHSVTKTVLKEATKDLLPPDFFERKKSGFSLPMYDWINRELKSKIYDCFKSTTALNYFEPKALNFLLQNIQNPFYANRIWLLLVTITWIQNNIE